jgi:alkylation response protein AidB-like acyl-CoA dehydrogenase
MAMTETAVAGGVSFALTPEQRELRALVREFAEKEIRPKAARVRRAPDASRGGDRKGA